MSPDLPKAVVDPSAAAEPSGWNAFAGSSYPDSATVPDKPPAPARPPLGRHSRAVSREQVPLSTRMQRALAAAVGAARTAASTAAARIRQGAAGMSKAGPDNRLLAGIAGIGLIFVIALLIGRGTSHPIVPSASRPATTAAPPPPRAPTPAQSSAGASTVPAPQNAQTFGAGNTGFQVVRLRYGIHAGYIATVFDLGAVKGTAPGSPKVTVSASNPTTLLVTFSGTVPAGSTGSPPRGKIISSVTLVSSSGNKTVYRFDLTRPGTATAFYLSAPARFVLEIHG